MPERSVDFRLYLVTDRTLFSSEALFLEALDAALQGGVKALQLREKDLPTRKLLKLAEAVRELTLRHGARLFINDRADVAVCVDADGVHLGHSSLPAHAVRKMIGDSRQIGVSAHSEAESNAAAEEGADFITFGPVFDTPSKRRYGAPLGTALLRRVATTVSVPVFGIGGIKRENLTEVLSARAAGVALISGILAEEDVRGAAAAYLRLLGA
jgi:thiamine-phosphate pyrophosphorylase